MAKRNIPLNSENICQYLKAKRGELGLSQRDMAQRLGYKNINFVSILENSRVKWPYEKIPIVIQSYELDSQFIAIMIKALYPEQWEMMRKIGEATHFGFEVDDFNSHFAKFENDVERLWIDLTNELNIRAA